MLFRNAFTCAVLVATAAAAPEGSFKALQQCVTGALTAGGDAVRRTQTPADATWEDARVGAIIKPETPAMVAFAKSFDEVGGLMGCAKTTGFQAVPRSGRHHFEGWSALNGSLVIDISQLSYVNVAQDLNSATIGAGTNLGEIYTQLGLVGKTFLGGICPTVALGGYLGVGGYNTQQRQLGLAIDQVISFKAILASGELVDVSPNSHPDLWWAARGGGQYAFILEATVKILTMPRSAMVMGFFNNESTRYEVSKKWLDWAPNQPAAFTSQLNVYSNRTQLIGWYLGGSTTQLQEIMDKSGLFEVAGANITISGNCSTENSRMFWQDPTTTCTDDETALKAFLAIYNTEQINLAPIEPEYRLDNVPSLPDVPPATPWPRFGVISKTYFTLKSNPLSDDTVRELIDRSGALSPDRGFWGEWTSFGIPDAKTTGSFPWLSDAETLMRIELKSPDSTNDFSDNRAWLLDFEKFFRPRVGSASYSGYVDTDISVNPLTAFYGNNTCRLIGVKAKYDPENFFRNPFSVPTTAPKDLGC